MADAYVIETAGETAGIVVLEKCGVRFYAAVPAFYPLDGKVFDSLDAAHEAVRALPQEVPRRRLRASFRRAA